MNISKEFLFLRNRGFFVQRLRIMSIDGQSYRLDIPAGVALTLQGVKSFSALYGNTEYDNILGSYPLQRFLDVAEFASIGSNFFSDLPEPVSPVSLTDTGLGLVLSKGSMASLTLAGILYEDPQGDHEIAVQGAGASYGLLTLYTATGAILSKNYVAINPTGQNVLSSFLIANQATTARSFEFEFLTYNISGADPCVGIIDFMPTNDMHFVSVKNIFLNMGNEYVG